MRKTILLGLLFISCIGCKKNEDFIEICYIREGVKYPIAINCEAIRDRGFNEIRENKIIREVEFISKFKDLLKDLKPSKSNDFIDVRMQVVTHFESKRDTLCVGLVDLSLNGEHKDKSKKLIELLINDIYKK